MGREALARMSIGREYAFMSDENEDPLNNDDVTKNHDKLKKMKTLPAVIKKMGIYIPDIYRTFIPETL